MKPFTTSTGPAAPKGRRARLVLALGALLAGTVALAGAPAGAYPHTVVVQQVAPKVKKAVTYVEYRNNRGEPVLDTDYDRGRIRIHARPFIIDEEMTGYDQYILKLNVGLPPKAKRGGWNEGWARIRVHTSVKGKVSDAAATRRRIAKKCASLPLTLNVGFGVIGTSVPLGQLRACRSAGLRIHSFQPRKGHVTWQLFKLRDLRSAELEFYIQVRAGRRPTFHVTVERPVDGCSKKGQMVAGLCLPTDREATATLVVPTVS